MADRVSRQEPVEPSADDIFTLSGGIVREFWRIRNAEYGGSWCQRGFLGILSNLFRKTDRLDVWFRDASGERPEGQAIPMDTVFDAAAYAMAQLSYVMLNRPREFEAWLVEQMRQYEEFRPAVEAVVAAYGVQNSALAYRLSQTLGTTAAWTRAPQGAREVDDFP
jgi:hypothetical protein